MRRLRAGIVVLFVCLLFSQPVAASPEIMPLSEVEPGMKGVGKTVITGTKIEKFDVEVVSILSSPKQVDQPLVLVKTSGRVIEETGGIASGMSGSPIYIDGKLMGAIGYGWEMANHKIGMVTPIKSMTDIFELEKKNQKRPHKKDIKLDSPIKIGSEKYNELCFTNNQKVESKAHTLIARPATTPLMVSGLTGRAKKRLDQELKNYDVKPMQAGGVVSKNVETNLQPGSAVAIQLVRGDINVSAIGTLTYRNQNQVLAFGHPFLSLGNVNYLLSSAYIHRMIKSVKMPFKIGSPINVKGIVNQDRTAGIAGEIGKYPNVIPVEVEVKDQDLGLENNFEFQVVQNKVLLQKLSAAALLQSIDSTIDRQGGGTARVNLQIMGSNLPDEVIEKENLYYSGNDIAAAAITDFLQALELIINNPFQEVNIADIKIQVTVEQTPRLALIEKIELNKEKVKPGEEVTATISLRPYRKELMTKQVTMKVPKDTNEGKLSLHVLSGQEANLDQTLSQQQDDQRSAQMNNIKSLNELMKVFAEKNQNNQLIVELRSNYPTQSNVEEQEIPSNGGYNKNDLANKVLDLEYVLQGALREEIEVIKPSTDKQKDKKSDTGSSS